MKHFIGKPSNITARIYEQLSNLRCKTLGEYKWYEDVFTTRVMHKVIEQNNYTNQCIHVIGKQLDRIEDRIENKVILQPGNSSKPIQAL